MEHLNINVHSEIGKLEGVIIHLPGAEVENMTPENAERALYSDILNLSVALPEYNNFAGVLRKFTKHKSSKSNNQLQSTEPLADHQK